MSSSLAGRLDIIQELIQMNLIDNSFFKNYLDNHDLFTGSLVINELPLECKHNWQEYEGFTSKDVFCTKCLTKQE